MDLLGFTIIVVKVLVVFAATMLGVLVMIYAERRVSAFMQDRVGPNRVGPKGVLQPIADGIKFLMKEDLVPERVDKPIFILAPAILLIPALMTFAVIPFGSSINLFGREIALQVADVNVGILYVLALTSISVYGIVLAGWSSNNKYSLLGGLRSSAQLISYELAMGLAVVSIILLAGSLRLNDIITDQIIKFGNHTRPEFAFASSIISAKIIPDKGAISDGLSTIVHPAAKAGITLRVI